MGCGALSQPGDCGKINEVDKENVDGAGAGSNIIKFGVFVKMNKKGLYKVNEVASSQEYSLPASGEILNTFTAIKSKIRHSK